MVVIIVMPWASTTSAKYFIKVYLLRFNNYVLLYTRTKARRTC